MIDRLFTAFLTFALLVGGTLAIGSALLGKDRAAGLQHASAPARVVRLDRVVVTAKRAPASRVAFDADGVPRTQ